jgi:hypothetical protein
MKMYLFISGIVLTLFSCGKPATMEVQKKEDMAAQHVLSKQAGINLLFDDDIRNFYIDYHYAIGSGSVTVFFTNNTLGTALFTVEVKEGNGYVIGTQTANMSPNSGIYFSFSTLATSGTLTAKVTTGAKSYSTSCTIYNATTTPGSLVYKATALSSTPVLALNYHYEPANLFKYYAPALVWTSFSNVVPNSPDLLYGAIRYPFNGGSTCLFAENHSNYVTNNRMNFNSLDNSNYLCMPTAIDYVWDKNPFNPDTVSASRWIRVNISW